MHFVHKLLLLILLIAVLPPWQSAGAQSRLELVHADVSRGKKTGTEQLKILEGNVHVRQDTVDIYCDTATFYEASNRLELQGNVRITRNLETLTARKVTYLSQRKLAICREDVYVREPGRWLKSEYLEYYYDSERAFAQTRVRLYDSESQTGVSADRGDYLPQENTCRMEGKAQLLQVDKQSGDSLHIRAERLLYYFAPRSEAFAQDQVVIEREGLVATCDSAIYYISREQADLQGNPVATQAENRLQGEAITLLFVENRIKRIIARGKALATSVADSTAQKINTLSGKEILALIENDEVDEMRAMDNARSRYFLEDKGVNQGVNTASADTIRIFFQAGELNRIAVKGGSQGIYYPEDYKGKIKEQE